MAAIMVAGSFTIHAQTIVPPDAASSTNSVSTNPVAPGPAPEREPEARPAPASGKLDYSSFKLVGDRNIFNGNRSGQRMTATRSSTQQRSVRVESFSLVGTLLSEDRAPVAFFDGSSSELRKALKAGETIAGFKVQEILHAGVRLAAGTNLTEVRVGSGLRREDEGLWKPSTTAANYASSSSSGSSGGGSAFRAQSDNNNNNSRSSGRSSRGGRGDNESSASSSPAASSISSADADEILKRLMEKREKE